MTTLLRTERLTIRAYREDDIAPTLEWLNDKTLMRYSGQRHKDHTPKTQRDYVVSFAWPNEYLALVHDDRLIGTATLYVEDGRADIGTLIGVSGYGYGTEAFGAMVDYALETRQIRKVTAGTLRDNVAMWRIYERHGLRLEGTLRDHEMIDGKPVDLLLYGLLRSDIAEVTW